MKTKTLSRIFASGLILALMSGCSAPAATPPASSGSETTPPATETPIEEEGYSLPIVKEPITLKFMTRESEYPGTSFNTTTPLIWQEFEKNTGIHIEFEAMPTAELTEAVQLRLAAKSDVPDMIQIPGAQDGSYLSRYLNDGVIVPLNDYINQYGTNIKKIFEAYPDYEKSLTLPDGSIAGFGNVRASQYGFRCQMIRQDWLDKLGLPMPTTPEELLETALAFAENDMNGNGQADEIGMSGYGTQWKEIGHAWGLHFVTGDGWDVEDGKIVFESITPAYQDFLRFLKKCVDSGAFPADWQSCDKETHLARVSNSQVGLFVRSPALDALNYLDPAQSMKQAIPEADWRVVPALDGPYGKGIFVKEPIAQLSRTVVVTSANKYPAETVKWLDYVIFSEEGVRYNQYGVEGLNYKIEDGKVIKTPSEWDDNKPQADGSWLGIGDYMPSVYTNESDEAVFAHLNLGEDNPALLSIQACWPTVEEPFVPPIPTVEDGKRVSALMADIKTYVDEMFYKFLNGEADIDKDFDKYVEQLESIGLNKVIGIYQSAYDARETK